MLLLEGATSQQMLRATFDAQLLLFMANASQQQQRAQHQQQQAQQGPQASAATPPAAAAAAAAGAGAGAAGGKAAGKASSRGGGSGGSSGAAPTGRHGRRGAARPLAALDRAAAALDPAASGWHDEAVQYVAREGPQLYRQFERQAEEQGWRIPLTMLNASETRLRVV